MILFLFFSSSICILGTAFSNEIYHIYLIMEGECLCKGKYSTPPAWTALQAPDPAKAHWHVSAAVSVKVNDDNLFGEQRRGHLCHCANCRKVAGGM